jgi:hypothetical protein
MIDTTKFCQRCGGKLGEYPALSRLDNLEYICSKCGVAEGMESFIYGYVRKKNTWIAHNEEGFHIELDKVQEFLDATGRR